MNLVQIVPTIDPEREGVSAVAVALSRAILPSTDRALVALGHGLPPSDENRDGSSTREGWRADEVHRVASELGAGDSLLLHYVGYGYHRRGAPRWLSKAWRKVRSSRPDLRLGVWFHEVHASGPPWRSSFWYRPLQRRVARQVLSASHLASTSLDIYRRILHELDPAAQVAVMPVLSTIGEPSQVPHFEARRPTLVVFGTAGVRARSYGSSSEAMASAVRALGIEEIVDVGDGVVAPETVGGIKVRRTGLLSAEAVGGELLRSRFGYLAYPPDFLDKSSIYGALLAHGVVTINFCGDGRGRPPRSGEPWIAATQGGIEGSFDFARTSELARSRYSLRSTDRHREFWLEGLSSV